MRSGWNPGRRIRRTRRRAACGAIWIFWKRPARRSSTLSLQNTQFADFHGHGWVFRAVYKRDRKGNLLDADDRVVPPDDKNKFQDAVHLKDIHLEKGMHCTDCHFERTATATGICTARLAMRWRSIAWIATGRSSRRRTCGRRRRRRRREERIFRCCELRRDSGGSIRRTAKSISDPISIPAKSWEVVQVVDSITPGNPHYSEASRLAKTLLKDGTTWGSRSRR